MTSNINNIWQTCARGRTHHLNKVNSYYCMCVCVFVCSMYTLASVQHSNCASFMLMRFVNFTFHGLNTQIMLEANSCILILEPSSVENMMKNTENIQLGW